VPGGRQGHASRTPRTVSISSGPVRPALRNQEGLAAVEVCEIEIQPGDATSRSRVTECLHSQLGASETERIHDDRYGAERHRGTRSDRTDQNAKYRIQHPSRNRHAERVVDAGQKQVLTDVAHRGPTQTTGTQVAGTTIVISHQLAVLRCQTDALNELEIIVRRYELAILRRRTGRPAVTESDRLFLAAASRLLPRARWPSFIITPTTLLRWHRQRWRGAGRTRIAPVDRRSVARSARLSCG
jgi:hypothetical protein